MVKIRLLRKGRKGQPFFSIIAIDSRRSPKSKKIIKDFGYYNPMESEIDKKIKIKDFSEINKFISNGAKVSLTLENIFKKIKKNNV